MATEASTEIIPVSVNSVEESYTVIPEEQKKDEITLIFPTKNGDARVVVSDDVKVLQTKLVNQMKQTFELSEANSFLTQSCKYYKSLLRENKINFEKFKQVE